MAKVRKYSVTFYPAKRDGAFISTSFKLFGDYPRVDFEAAGMDDLKAKVAKLAEGRGGCSAVVSVADGGRNPPGFGGATRHLFFNLGD